MKTLERGEEIGLTIITIFIISMLILSFKTISIENLSYINTENIFSPFGVVLFALLGFSAIPEIKRIMKDKSKMKKVIISSYILTAILYIIFTILILGINGKSTPQIATLSLGKPFILLGIITMFTAYLALSNALIDTLKFDFKLSRKLSWLIINFIPLLIFLILELIKKSSFIKILSIGGAISATLTIILIFAMLDKARLKGDRNPEYQMNIPKIIKYIIIILFLIGTMIEIL